MVEDTLDGLWRIGAAGRERMTGGVVAITGSSGKTTARQWLQEILTRHAPTHASRGSLNNHWGVPLSLARMPATTAFGVFEIGTNNPGEIALLAELVRPKVALLLNVLPAHLGRFPSLDAIRVEKLSIEAGLDDEGIMVIPENLPHGELRCRNVVSFGVGETADVAARVDYQPGFADVVVAIGGSSWQFRLNAGGEHRVLTALGVFAVLYALGVDLDEVAADFSSLTIPSGRGNLVTAGKVTLIDDSYNANPVSMKHAIEALSAHGGQRVAILGEMLELGEEGERMHMDLVASCEDLDGVITVGKGFENWPRAAGDRYWGHFADAADIDVAELAGRLLPGAHLLVKGSNKVFWTSGFVARLTEALRVS
jgi:UDP-N-acetylmuramoyl-tripeptide--D-alanyl-D-alanine ligase